MIRVGSNEDCYAVYLLICEMENCTLCYGDFEKIYSKMMNDDAYTIFVALKDGKVVGEITLRIEEQLHHCAKVAEIMECAVSEKYRCCGFGSRLFKEAYDFAVRENCVQIEVSSNQVRLRAHTFYERLGMKNTHYKFCMPIS